MTLTQVDIDADALTEAMRLSGERTKKDMVNVALREYAARHGRIEALDTYASLAKGWDYAGWKRRRASEKEPGE